MKEYHKINTVFKRDDKGRLILGDWSRPEYEMLKDIDWIATEKIDGTNIRVTWDGFNCGFKGKTDRAIIPVHLHEELFRIFPEEKMAQQFDRGYIENNEQIKMQVCLYGEGFGRKIQKGGNYIPEGVSFILFDIRIGKWWLKRDDVELIAESMGINTVPIIGKMTVPEAIEYVKRGFKSTIAQNKDYEAEGLVLKPEHDLFLRNGERVVLKIKKKDFR